MGSVTCSVLTGFYLFLIKQRHLAYRGTSLYVVTVTKLDLPDLWKIKWLFINFLNTRSIKNDKNIIYETMSRHSLCFFCEGPRSRCYGRTAALKLIVQSYEEDDSFFPLSQVMEHRWNETDRGKPKYSGEKPVPVPLCPPQIPHGLTWDRTRASAVRGRRLTAWAMARPPSLCYC
jgi:hypothetical protein